MKTLTQKAAIALAFLAGVGVSGVAKADDFVGAVWKFRMESYSGAKLQGRYRISNHVMYQRSVPSDSYYGKLVGQNYPDGDYTEFEVHNMRVFGPDGQFRGYISGTASLSCDHYGQWTGEFVGSKGVRWRFRCIRYRE